jgi:wyosine [tRNA(Phe)-imidazoG37] synthetase (radical SAM superfamily)
MTSSLEFPKFDLLDCIIYGPVSSRRFGRSLGINLLPSGKKVCNFECCYCQLGWSEKKPKGQDVSEFRWAEVKEIAGAFRDGLKQHRGELDSATLSGNGEPTLHPEFSEVCTELCRVRDEADPDVKLVALTNGTRLTEASVTDALNLLDERVVKLDAGRVPLLRAMNHPSPGFSVNRLCDGAAKLDDFILQSMFVQGAVDNTGEEDVKEWVSVLKSMGPKHVEIYSLARLPASAGLHAASPETLERIAQIVREETGILAEVFA